MQTPHTVRDASVVVPIARRRRAAALKKKSADPVNILAHEQQMQNAISVQDFIDASLDVSHSSARESRLSLASHCAMITIPRH